MTRFRLVTATGSAVIAALALVAGAISPVAAAPAPGSALGAGNPYGAGKKVVGYFTDWGIYGRNYQVKNVETSGSAAKLTDLVYAFGNTAGGLCSIGDSWADTDRPFTAEESVDGVADSTDAGTLHGNFGQLRKLKKLHPGLKILWSFGGYSWSGGFSDAAKDPAAFADSCAKLVEDPRWADVFDGIDIDWEYPNACGLTCDTSGKEGYRDVLKALRAKFGRSELISSAVSADGTSGGKLEAADYAGGAKYLDWVMAMTYDYYGTWAATGPTAPNSPLTGYKGAPTPGFDTVTTISKLKRLGVPSTKILLGIGFYGHGWTGVTQSKPGGTATGPAPGVWEAGTEDYKVLKARCPATGYVGGTAYAKCGDEWWSYDTPATVTAKMLYARLADLGGSFFWELSGDTSNGELISAISRGLR